ncbi:MAG: Actin- protein 2/3 complex subunit 3 [Sclerophora amabilis]|nr:MAG: Actin- protein 2/3 complex subunit 3 [Sclerophora amabilis]
MPIRIHALADDQANKQAKGGTNARRLLTLKGNFALLPLRTRTRGPAYTLPPLPSGVSDLDIDPDSESYDPLDEVLSLFRANTFFRNFEIKGPADRLLIYGILFVSDCLGKVRQGMGLREAEKVSERICLAIGRKSKGGKTTKGEEKGDDGDAVKGAWVDVHGDRILEELVGG